MRRVVVTGMGAVSPLGGNLKDTWDGVVSGRSGISGITRFDASSLKAQIAGAVPFPSLDGPEHCVEMEHVLSAKEQKRMDDFVLFGMYAAHEALEDAGWSNPSDEGKERTGVIAGTGCPGIVGIESEVVNIENGGRVSPFFLPRTLGNMFVGHAAMRYGFHASNFLLISACASGGHAVGMALRAIQRGDVDVVLAGGTEGALCRTSVAGFAAMRALATSFNERPSEASRPWDKGCEGFVLSEGAGMLVLEDYEHARSRGAHMYAEVVGFGDSCDAHHVSAPHPEGLFAGLCIERALREAKIEARDVGHINAHGTSTPVGDGAELIALRRALGSAAGDVPVTSNKSCFGHLLGAAGALELIIAIQSIRHNVVPQTINTHDLIDAAEGMQIVCGQPLERVMHTAVSNSFGFGGTNTALVVREC